MKKAIKLISIQTGIPLVDFIRSLNIIADFVDVDTKDHSRGTRDIALIIASELGYKTEKLIHLGYGADVHDIGKIAISPVVFRQPSKLTRAQYAAVKKHPEFGHEMIRSNAVPKIIQDCVLYHHEHYDGSGYPYGTKGRDIPRVARITCLADVWESVNSDRPYRKKMPKQEALDFMNEHSGWFDPDIYSIFADLIRREVL